MYFINGLYTLASGAINIFQAANPGAGVANGTQITAAWLNDVQGELLNPLTVAGVAPAASTPTQMLQALKRIFGGNRLAVTASTTLTADNAGLVVVNAASGNVVLTLPLNSSAGGTPLEFVFMRTDSSANTVTVVDAGSDADAPGGATSLSVIAGTPLWLRGDGASVWDIVLNLSATSFAAFGISNREKLFTSSGTWTCPAGITQVFATIVGGGGGAGASAGSAGSTGGQGGGGAGSYVRQSVTVVPGTVYPVTVGAGGTGAIYGGAAASAGGSSTFNGYTATGGGAGGNGTTGASTAGTPGGSPGMGGYGNSPLTWGGAGGGNLLSSGTPGGIGNAGARNAVASGSGGAGGDGAASGGNGASGYVFLEW